ncbi:MAG: NADPH:quinone reductase-like Zn-dependent oxidoreductase/acyl carrier protein, partial [Myxococcota bacterium]
ADLSFHKPTTTIASALDDSRPDSPDFWVRHIREPVDFLRAISAHKNIDTWIEIGPHTTLAAIIKSALPDAETIHSMRRQSHGLETVRAALRALYVRGGSVDWAAVLGGGAIVPLPAYPFQRSRFWITDQADGVLADTGLAGRLYPLPGGVIHRVLSLSPTRQPWLADHVVHGVCIAPGALFVSAILDAALQSLPGITWTLSDVLFSAPLPIGAGVELHLLLRPKGEESWSFEAASRQDGEWWVHASGGLDSQTPPEATSLDVLQKRCAQPRPVGPLFAQLQAAGVDWGPGWRWLSAATSGDGEALTTLRPPESVVLSVPLHPVLLDNAFVSGLLLQDATDTTPRLPFSIQKLHFRRTLTAATCHVRRSGTGEQLDLDLLDDRGHPAVQIEGFATRAAPASAFAGLSAHRAPADRLSVIRWSPVTLPATPPAGRWAVVDAHGSGAPLATALSAPCLAPGEALPEGCSDVVVLLEDESSASIPEAVSVRVAVALAITRQVLERPEITRLWWLTRSGQAVAAAELPVLSQSALWGMGRTVDRECALTCILIDLPEVRAVDEVAKLCAALWAPPVERELALRGGRWQAPRLVEAPTEQARAVAIHQSTPGDLASLLPRPLRRTPPGPGQVAIAVHAAGLNFRDVLGALGMYPGEVTGLGGECAGEVVAVGEGVECWAVGDRVIAMAPSFCTHTLADIRHLALWPEHLSAGQAATLPIAFLTAWHGLVTLGQLKPGERVLIHSAAGGVGLAAIQIARQRGAIIHATASRPKWAQLQAMGITHIHSSRDLRFADEIIEATGGAGVDVVLNALTGAFIDRSLALLRPGGRFVEMGKRDIRDPATLPDGIAYCPFDLHRISVEEPVQLAALFEQLSRSLADETLQPILRHTFPLSGIQDAFRWMAQARHTGKIALRIAPVVPEPTGAVVITGGLGALGLVVARWLVEECDCQHLVLVSRSGLKPGSAPDAVVEALRQHGARIDVPTADVCDSAAVSRLINGITGRLQGIIHAAGVLDDALITDLTSDRIDRVLAPKVHGAWNLHRATEGRALSFFALFSSAASLLGSASQTSYAAANGFLDGLAAWRRAQGQVAVSIGWGPWSEGGMAARLGEAQQHRLRQTGILPISPRQGAAMFAAALRQDAAVVGAIRLDRARLRVAMPPQVAPPMLLDLIGAAPSAAPAPVADLIDRLTALSTEQRPAMLSGVLQEVVAGVLGATDPAAISVTRSFQDTGFDSLMAVELRNRVRALLDQPLPATLAFDYPDITRLTAYLLELLDLSDAVVETERSTGTSWSEPIAVVGMACRFPGAADLASFQQLLS